MEPKPDVKTAGRTVDLFEIFARSKTPMTLSEIARALSAPQSSCFSLVRALEARGYLYAVGGAKRLYPTRKLLDIAGAIAAYQPVIPRLAALLETLRDETQETVILGAKQGNQAIYLAVAESEQTIRYISRAGELKPLYASAMGKSLLMTMPIGERKRLLSKINLKRNTENTITDAGDLLADIQASEERGFSISKGENVADVMALAIPIRVESMVYSITVAGPTARMEPRIAEHVATIRHLFHDHL